MALGTGGRALRALLIRAGILVLALLLWFPPAAGMDHYTWAVCRGMPEWYVDRLLGPCGGCYRSEGQGLMKSWWSLNGSVEVCFQNSRVKWVKSYRQTPPN